VPLAATTGRVGRHAWPAIACAALAVVWSYPLITNLAAHLPGEGLGDNATFVWNFWWARQAMAHPGWQVFQTDRLFAPFGADLTLHTHTALPAFLGATLFSGLSPVAAQNVVILAALWLNAFAAYLLAVDRTGDRGGAMLAALVFGGSPYVFLHLLGHFNLIHAWTVPLFALWFFRALDRGHGSRREWLVPSTIAGLVLVAVAYTDYYYLVYCVAIAVGVTVWSVSPKSIAVSKHAIARPLFVVLTSLLFLDVVLITAILVTGGFTLHLAGNDVSAFTLANPLSLGWLVVIVWACARYRPHIRLGTREPSAVAAIRVRALAPMAVVAGAGLLPLVARGWAMWMRGDYVMAPPSWRSGPGGVDVATFFLGNPLNPLLGSSTAAAYARLGIDRIEKCGWIGVVPIALAAWTLAGSSGRISWRSDARVANPQPFAQDARRWTAIGALFFVWALGPWLRIAEVSTGLALPQNLFQYIPILGNARMPGRAMVVVMLAVAMLCAIGVAQFNRQQRRLWLPLLALGVAVDFLPAPYPVVSVDTLPAYASALASQPDAAVCPLPIAWRDGYGEVGHFDGRLLLDQLTHGHALVGGFVARLPASTAAAYRATPVLRSLLSLSEGKPASAEDLALSAEESAAALTSRGIRFIAIDRHAASDDLVAYVREKLPTSLVVSDPSNRDLLEIVSPRTP